MYGSIDKLQTASFAWITALYIWIIVIYLHLQHLSDTFIQ